MSPGPLTMPRIQGDERDLHPAFVTPGAILELAFQSSNDSISITMFARAAASRTLPRANSIRDRSTKFAISLPHVRLVRLEWYLTTAEGECLNLQFWDLSFI
jgi:hypothetical protein